MNPTDQSISKQNSTAETLRFYHRTGFEENPKSDLTIPRLWIQLPEITNEIQERNREETKKQCKNQESKEKKQRRIFLLDPKELSTESKETSKRLN